MQALLHRMQPSGPMQGRLAANLGSFPLLCAVLKGSWMLSGVHSMVFSQDIHDSGLDLLYDKADMRSSAARCPAASPTSRH